MKFPNLINGTDSNQRQPTPNRCRRQPEISDKRRMSHKKFPIESEESLMIADKMMNHAVALNILHNVRLNHTNSLYAF